MRYMFFFLIVSQVIFSQNRDYPKNDFIAPLDIPLNLSGNFGELRYNHFHAGLDFKTMQKTGWPVYAVADGYVSRIKISFYGYGKALYITHQNGYTTVYGHLERLAPELEQFIKKEQYRQKSFEVEVFLKPSVLPVRQGQLIAFSGNTGGSGGAHLHFEVRDSKTENIINPLLFGFDACIEDTQKPVIQTLYVYPLGTGSYANQSEKPTVLSLSLQEDGTYLSQTVMASGIIGFGANVYDLFDKNFNKNGVYKISCLLNGVSNFEITFDEFAFSETRYVNAYIDYAKLKSQKTWVQKLFFRNRYPLSLINQNLKNGTIEVLPNMNHTYQIELSDYHGNQTKITIPITYSQEIPKITRDGSETPYMLQVGKENLYEEGFFSVFVPKNTFYEDFELVFRTSQDTLWFADTSIPVHKNYAITFQESTITMPMRSKTYIASLEGKTFKYNKTGHTETTFTVWTREVGTFTLKQDTLPPYIKPLNFYEAKWISNEPRLWVEILDQDSGIKTYDAYLNDEWILMEYDYKTNQIFYDFDDGNLREGRNDFRLIVTDNVGNSATFETYFFRSQRKNE